MDNFKSKKQQHTQLINKMFCVQKKGEKGKKRNSNKCVCAVKTKSSKRLGNKLSGLKRQIG